LELGEGTGDPGPPHPPGENAQVYSDPLAPFNEKMFWFNLRMRLRTPLAALN